MAGDERGCVRGSIAASASRTMSGHGCAARGTRHETWPAFVGVHAAIPRGRVRVEVSGGARRGRPLAGRVRAQSAGPRAGPARVMSAPPSAASPPPAPTGGLSLDAGPRADDAADRQQLDLFIDGRDALLIHEVVTGLLAGDVARAEKGLQRSSVTSSLSARWSTTASATSWSASAARSGRSIPASSATTWRPWGRVVPTPDVPRAPRSSLRLARARWRAVGEHLDLRRTTRRSRRTTR